MLTPSLETLLKNAIRSEIARVHTQVPARVISYDRSSQTAEIQLVVSQSYLDPEAGERVFYKPPPIVNVPVIFPAILTWPLKKDDPGWVQFAERSIVDYLETGRDVEPKDSRRFDLTDAVFYPTYMRGEADTADGAAVLSVDEIRIGGSSVSTYLARADRVEERLQAIEKYLREHEHVYTAPAIPAAPAPTNKALLGGVNPPGPPDATAPTTIGGATNSDKVKGE